MRLLFFLTQTVQKIWTPLCRFLAKIIFMNNADEKFLRDKENRIKLLLSRGDISFIKAFNFLYKYYSLDNVSGKTPVLSVFEAIYIKNIKLPAWRLAIYCNISRSTLFNYRNLIVSAFHMCINENIITDDVALTKEEINEF